MALTLDQRTAAGDTTATVALDESFFGVQPNVPVMHQVVTAQLAAARAGTQSTKTRAEVSGGGRKPFKQKGTGRARQGSERAPHFAGGGVALGPKPRSYVQKTPRKMIQLALRSALSDRATEGKVAVVERWPWEAPSTKAALAALDVLGLAGRVLVVLSRKDEEAYKSFRNLTDVQLIVAGELNAYDVLCNDWVVFTSETLPGQNVTVPVAPAEKAPAKKAAKRTSAGAKAKVEAATDEPAVPVAAGDEAGDEPGDEGPAGDEPAEEAGDE
jgi:large subunit ribosomal protein L4